MMRTILILFLLHSTSVKADDIENLIMLIGVDSMIEKAYEECLEGAQNLLTEELHIESQSKNLGIDRDHKYWKELEAIFTEFYAVACEYVSIEDSKNIWRKVYSDGLTAREVDQLIEFYSSPIGKKITQLDIKANSDLQEMASKRYAKKSSRAQRVYEYRINQLMRKLEAEEHDNPFHRTQSLTPQLRLMQR